MDSADRGPQKFIDLLARLVRVPKSEIEEQDRRESRKFKTRTTHKAYAKPGQIAAQPEQ